MLQMLLLMKQLVLLLLMACVVRRMHVRGFNLDRRLLRLEGKLDKHPIPRVGRFPHPRDLLQLRDRSTVAHTPQQAAAAVVVRPDCMGGKSHNPICCGRSGHGHAAETLVEAAVVITLGGWVALAEVRAADRH